jgi:hypothetical protein
MVDSKTVHLREGFEWAISTGVTPPGTFLATVAAIAGLAAWRRPTRRPSLRQSRKRLRRQQPRRRPRRRRTWRFRLRTQQQQLQHGPDSLVARTLVAAHVAPHDTTAGGDDAPTCNYETGATTVNPRGEDSDAEDSHSEDEPSVTERCLMERVVRPR